MGPLDDQVVRSDSLVATPDGLDIAVYSHWYRALPLPSLARLELTVDGQPVDLSTLSVTVNGHRYPFEALTEKDTAARRLFQAFIDAAGEFRETRLMSGALT